MAIPQRSIQRNKLISVVISVLMHLLALWLIVWHRPEPPLAIRGTSESVTTLVLLQDSQQPSTAASPPVIATRPHRPAVKSLRQPREAIHRPAQQLQPRERLVVAPPPLTALDKSLPATKLPIPPENPPEDDFSSRLAARQRQRADEENQERTSQDARGSPEQQANARGKQIALANIASQLRAAGLEKDDAGGLFQLQHVGPHHAEFLFRGWKKEARRNWSQQLDVEQGNEADIRIAVVKKMIEIIRQHTQAEFTWDSHRLGRQIHLSARPEDSAGLQQFLLREFFPDFGSAGP